MTGHQPSRCWRVGVAGRLTDVSTKSISERTPINTVGATSGGSSSLGLGLRLACRWEREWARSSRGRSGWWTALSTVAQVGF
jgi:hypothetical protein